MSTNGVGGPSPVTPSQFTPKSGTSAPVNGTATTTQPPAPAVTTPAVPSEVEQLKAKLAEAEKREGTLKREVVVGRTQWQREREQQKQTFAEKLKDADWAARIRKLAAGDKLGVVRELFGEKGLEELNTLAANGGAPTAASVADAIEQAERRAEEKFKQQQAEQQKQAEESERQAFETDVQTARSEAALLFEHKGADYPLLAEFGDKEAVGRALANNLTRAELDRYRAALKVGDTEARIGIMRAVAERVEARAFALAEKAFGTEKYAPKLREKLTPAQKPGNPSPVVKSSQPQSQQSPSSQSLSQGRRSLSNDLTGSTPPDAPTSLTDDERMRRALAKYEEALAAKGKA
jgi:hypothetical protein